MEKGQRFRSFFFLLLLLGLLTALVLGVVSHPRKEIGCRDMAAYADMARSIVDGHPFYVGFVQHYFLKYNHPFHPLDHYFPLKGLLIAPFFRFLGVSPFAALLPSLIIGCLLFPPLIFGICRRLDCSPAACFVGGLVMLWHPLVITNTAEVLADLDFSFFAACALFCLLGKKTWRQPVLAAFWMAAAFLTKLPALFFLPGFSLFFLADKNEKFSARWKNLVLFLFLFFLFSSPWLLRNIRLYGDPLFTTNRYVAGLTGYESVFEWDGPGVALYWEKEPPALTSVLSRYGYRHAAEVLAQRFLVTLKSFPFLGVLVLVPFFTRERSIRVIALCAILYALFSLVTFAVHERYLLAVLPAGVVLTAFLLNLAGRAMGSLFSRPFAESKGVYPGWFYRPGKVATIMILMSLLFFLGDFAESTEKIIGKYGKYRTRATSYPYLVSQWIDLNLPEDAVIMTTSPVEIRYYTNKITLTPASGTPRDFREILDHYQVEYLALPPTGSGPLFAACREFIRSPLSQAQLLVRNKSFRVWRLKKNPALSLP